jgi:amidase
MPTSLREASRAFVPYPEVPVAHAAQGPLAGLTLAVKDLFDVAGYPTGAGQPLMLARSGLKTRHAPVVQTLLDAGARFVGKTVTDELAFSLQGQNMHFGQPVNAAAPQRLTGGSSSGSASAVAHGLCDVGLGSDTGGSIRAPASHCGLYGMRPTHGRIELSGAHALAPSLDACGWFTRDLDTFIRVAGVLLGEAPREARVRLLAPTEIWGLLSGEVSAALQQVWPALERAAGPMASQAILNHPIDALTLAFRQTQGWEAWQVNGDFVTRFAPVMEPGVAQRLQWSSQVSRADYEAAQALRSSLRTHLARLLGEDGVLVMPSMPDVAPLASDGDADLEAYRAASLRMLCIAGLTGFAQFSLPWARRLDAPLGFSLLAGAGQEALLMGLARQVERAMASA